MSLFEAQVGALRQTLSAYKSIPVAPAKEELPFTNARAGLILQNDTFCELGGPQRSSALTLVYTNGTASEGARRIGSIVPELKGCSTDFALVVMVAGEKLDAETFYQFTLRFPKLADHPNWMVKVDKSKIWVRVGENNVDTALEVAATSLIDRIHKTFDLIESVELYIVLDEKTLVESLSKTADQCQKLMRDIKTNVWQDRGFDYESCELAGHCGSCSDKKTCASVRKIQAKVNLVRKTKNNEKES